MRRPRLYLFIGYPGSGKTTVSQLIARRTGAVHLWADHERLKLFGKPTHSVEESNKLYDHLNNLAGQLLGEGKSVIFDTNFNFHDDREHLREIAVQQGANTVVIWVTTPVSRARQRAVGETAKIRNGYFSTMTDKQFDAIAAKLQSPTENEKVIKIDGTKLDERELIRLLKL